MIWDAINQARRASTELEQIDGASYLVRSAYDFLERAALRIPAGEHSKELLRIRTELVALRGSIEGMRSDAMRTDQEADALVLSSLSSSPVKY